MSAWLVWMVADELGIQELDSPRSLEQQPRRWGCLLLPKIKDFTQMVSASLYLSTGTAPLPMQYRRSLVIAELHSCLRLFLPHSTTCQLA
jgi:hypothetical protein